MDWWTRDGFKTGTLIFFSGKMGAGKSTRSVRIPQERKAVLLSEDDRLGSLYPDQIASLDEYIKYSRRLKPQMKKLVQSILMAGTDVVMNFPANTRSQREWFRTIFDEVQAPHSLVFVDAPEAVCLERISARRLQQPERAATDTVAMFERVTRHFEEPSPEEGFNIVRLAMDA